MVLWPGWLYPGSSLYDYQLTSLLQLWDKIHKALKPLARDQILSPPPNPYTHSRSLNSREEQGFREQTPGKSRSQQEDGNPCCGWPEQSAPAIKSGFGKTFGVWSPSTIPSDSKPRHSQPKRLLTVNISYAGLRDSIFHSTPPTSIFFTPSPRSGSRDTKRTLGEYIDRNSDPDPDSNKLVLLSVLR